MKSWAPISHRELRSSLPLPPPPPFLLPNNLVRHAAFIAPSSPFTASRATRRRRSCSLASAAAERRFEASWMPVDGSSNDGYGGWSITVSRPQAEDKNALLKFMVVGAGATMAVLVAAFSWHFISRKGFKFQHDASFHTLCELLLPSERAKDPVKDIESPPLKFNPSLKAELDEKADMAPDAPKPKEVNLVSVLEENKRIIVPLVADATQQEALSVLKKLKIIENDASADELCTRREYARWLVKTNSMLERNPKYRIVPLISITSSMVTAFDDVSVNDPDFLSIQAIGEAGIVLSKLSAVNLYSLSDVGRSDDQGRVDFSPDSLISRFDLLNWKALLEYSFTSKMDDKMLRKKVGFLDLSAVIQCASLQLLTDLIAGDKSITRRVFGNIRRLQPHKPVTKAQAAVALISGRMAEAIRAELSRLDMENLSRFAEMEEIRSELILRGEIQKLWEEKLNREKERGFEVERDLHVALQDLEKEKVARDESFAVYMKDKAALDCQQQLLLRLKEEVDGMYDRLANEIANLLSEQQSLAKLLVDLLEKQDAMLEAKSILEAEKEAIQILRSWVEEEARRIQGRAKILKQASERWKWSGMVFVVDKNMLSYSAQGFAVER